MTAPRTCSFAWPGTFGHTCDAPGVFAGLKRTDSTRDGVFWAVRCARCKEHRGTDNVGIERWEPYDPARHVNHWR